MESSFRILSLFYLKMITGNTVGSLGRLWWVNGFMCTYDQVLEYIEVAEIGVTS